jgi:hypothetical protein
MSEVGRIEQGPAVLAAATRVAERVVDAAPPRRRKRAEINWPPCVLAATPPARRRSGVGKTLLAQTIAAAIGGSFVASGNARSAPATSSAPSFPTR